jgi:dihydroneopterin aldolase
MPEGTLTLRGIELRVVLGVLPVERISGRVAILDMEWSGTIEPGGPPAVDYAAACSTLALLEGRAFEFIEDLAFAALGLLEERFPTGRWKVTVHKDRPQTDPVSARASVTIGPD